MNTLKAIWKAIGDVLLISAYIHFFGVLVVYAVLHSDFRPLNFFTILQFHLLFPKITAIQGYDIIATLCLTVLLIYFFAKRAKEQTR